MGLHTAPVFEKYFLDLYPNTVYLRTTAYLFEIDESIEKNARFLDTFLKIFFFSIYLGCFLFRMFRYKKKC